MIKSSNHSDSLFFFTSSCSFFFFIFLSLSFFGRFGCLVVRGKRREVGLGEKKKKGTELWEKIEI